MEEEVLAPVGEEEVVAACFHLQYSHCVGLKKSSWYIKISIALFFLVHLLNILSVLLHMLYLKLCLKLQ